MTYKEFVSKFREIYEKEYYGAIPFKLFEDALLEQYSYEDPDEFIFTPENMDFNKYFYDYLFSEIDEMFEGNYAKSVTYLLNNDWNFESHFTALLASDEDPESITIEDLATLSLKYHEIEHHEPFYQSLGDLFSF